MVAATEAAAFLLTLAGAEATGAGAATTVAAAGSTAFTADFLVVVLEAEVLILVFSEEVFEDMERGY